MCITSTSESGYLLMQTETLLVTSCVHHGQETGSTASEKEFTAKSYSQQFVHQTMDPSLDIHITL